MVWQFVLGPYISTIVWSAGENNCHWVCSWFCHVWNDYSIQWFIVCSV